MNEFNVVGFFGEGGCFCRLFDRTVSRQETKLEREKGDGIGKDPRAGNQTWDA